MTTAEHREAILEDIIDMMFSDIEAAPEARAALAELRRLAPADQSGRDLVDAAINYASALARQAFLVGLAFDVRAVLDQAVAEKLAGALLDSEADVVTLYKILGHASPVTTARYDRRPEGLAVQS